MNAMIIAEFRANDGRVETAGFGDRLVLLHHRGARSGVARVAPLMGIPMGGSWLIAASAAGAPKHPGWYRNLREHPDTEIEVPGPDGGVTVPVRAVDLEGSARDDAWARFTTASPGFRDYEKRAGDRVIPVLRLDPR